MVKIELGKRDFIWIGLLIVFVGVGFGYAYGGDEPSIMGHSSGELEIAFEDTTSAQAVCSGDTFLSGEGACWTAEEIVAAAAGSGSGATLNSKECYDGDVYWYDSSGVIGAKAEECGSVNAGCYEGACSECRFDNYPNCRYNPHAMTWTTLGCTYDPIYYWFDNRHTDITWIIWADDYVGGLDLPEIAAGESYVSNGYRYHRGEYNNNDLDSPMYEICRQLA